MRSTTTIVVAGVLLALAACAAPPAPKALPPGAAGPAIARAAADEDVPTGSRIPRRQGSTDRVLKTVGALEARAAMGSGVRPLDAR